MAKYFHSACVNYRRRDLMSIIVRGFPPGCIFLLILICFPAYAIQPWSENPAYWEHEGAPILLLGSSVTDHLFLGDGEVLTFAGTIDLLAQLDEMQNIGANYVRNTMSQRENWPLVAFHRMEGGMDDGGKFNLDQFNDACDVRAPHGDIASDCYWTRFNGFLRETAARDIIVQIEVWDRFDYRYQVGADPNVFHRTSWLKSPWRPENNVNYSNAESGFSGTYPRHPSDDVHSFFHGVPGHPCYELAPSSDSDPCTNRSPIPAPRKTQAQYDVVRHYQEAFVDKMLSYSLNYDHVLYVMNNETSTHSSWGIYWMNYIRSKAAVRQKAVYVTDMFGSLFAPFPGQAGEVGVETYHNHPNLYNFLEVSQVNSKTMGSSVRENLQNHWKKTQYIIENAMGNRFRPVNHVKIYDGLGTSLPLNSNMGIHQMVNNLLLGAASVRHHRPFRRDQTSILLFPNSIQAIRMVENKVKFWDLEPLNALLSARKDGEAFLAAQKGEAYVLYFPRGGSVGLNLKAWVGQPFVLDWMNYSEARWLSPSSRIEGGKVRTITAPDSGSWIAVMTKQTSAKTSK